MKVTAKTIAEQLNISPATVDRVLHNRGGVSPKTIKKVQEKANELNYTPNKSASFLARRKSLRIAFIIPNYPEYFWKEIELGIHQTLEDIQDYGFNVEIIKVPHQFKEQMKIIQKVSNSKHYNGLVICPTDAIPLTYIINEKIEQGFPVYLLNNDSPSSKRLSYIGANYFESGRLAGDLLDKFTGSSKRFALITDEQDTFQMREKRKGFEAFIKESKDIHSIKQLKIDNNKIIESIRQFESDFKKVDGIYVACGALAEIAEEINNMDFKQRPILVGHDINKKTFDYLQNDIVTATICQDPVYQGSQAVRIVFNHLMLEKPIEKTENIVKLEIVTKMNARYYMLQDS